MIGGKGLCLSEGGTSFRVMQCISVRQRQAKTVVIFKRIYELVSSWSLLAYADDVNPYRTNVENRVSS